MKRPARNSSRIVSTTAAQKASPQRSWASRSPMTVIDWLSGATNSRTPLRSAVSAIPSRSKTTAASARGSATSRSATCTRISPRDRVSASRMAATIRSSSRDATNASGFMLPSSPAARGPAATEGAAAAGEASAPAAAPSPAPRLSAPGAPAAPAAVAPPAPGSVGPTDTPRALRREPEEEDRRSRRSTRSATSGTPFGFRGGGALYSPRVAAMMPSMPASRPPVQSPARNRGRTCSSRIRPASWSGSAPSRP